MSCPHLNENDDATFPAAEFAMLTVQELGSGEEIVFFLHLLGGSGREWRGVADLLQTRFRCVLIDLPGFGGSAQLPGYTVDAMADAVAEVISLYAPSQWRIAGHSMGAKVATVIARRAEDGAEGLAGLAGVILVAGSPPSPEPMTEKRRQTMESWFAGDAEKSRKEAEKFVQDNLGRTISPELKETAIADVLRCNRSAWKAWLESGSREDWSARIGVLRTPALVLAGEKDKDLGPDAQRTLMMPHFAQSRFEVLSGAKHLLPMECPDELAELIAEHASAAIAVRPPSPPIDPDYQALIDSERVSPATREALMNRALPDDPAYTPESMSVEELATLRAVIARIVPQARGRTIDLAARIDHELTEAKGDGWRFAALPPDAEAYRAGLRTLDESATLTYNKAFGALKPEQQDKLLTGAASGDLKPGFVARAAVELGIKDAAQAEFALNAEQMRLWFEDVRADATRNYVAHPATLAGMGYSGIADGAESRTASGFVRIGMNERETWEPEARRSESAE